MRFRDVLHQERALSVLRRRLASGRVPHALLFEGPEGTGKEKTAAALAARVMCLSDLPSDAPEACGQCASCVALARGGNPDYLVVERGLHKVHPDPAVRRTRGLFLSVDLIRQFISDTAALAPALGRRRVYVIRDAERMNEQAQNALLKTLEEPAAQTLLILVSASADRLLSTIRSRCQRVVFAPLPAGFIRDRLAAEGCASDEAALLAELSQGSLGAAQRWRSLGLAGLAADLAARLAEGPERDPEAFAKYLIGAAEALLKTEKRGAAPDESDDESDEEEPPDSADGERPKTRAGASDEQRRATKLLLLLAAAALRAALLERSGAPPELRSFPAPRAISELAAGRDAIRIADGIRAVIEAERMIDRNVSIQLSCERLAIALGGEVLAEG